MRPALMDSRGQTGHPVTLERQEVTARRGSQGLADHQDPKVLRDSPDHRDLRVQQDLLVHRDLKDHKDPSDQQVRPVMRVRLVRLVFQDPPDQMVNREHQDKQEAPV